LIIIDDKNTQACVHAFTPVFDFLHIGVFVEIQQALDQVIATSFLAASSE